MSVILRSDIAAELLPTLKSILGEMDQKPKQWSKIFNTEMSDKDKETSSMMRYTPYASIKAEGAPTVVDSMGQSYVTTTINRTIAQSFEITREAMRDNQYKDQFPQGARALKNGLAATKEVLAADILNQAFNLNHVFGDGQPLSSIAHPILGGSYSNDLRSGNGTIDLSITGIQQMILLAQALPAENGIRANINVETIVIPPALQFIARTLLESEYSPEDANNSINSIRGIIKNGYTVNYQITSNTAFFGLTDAFRSRIHYEREKVQSTTWINPDTFNFKATALESYSFGINDPRGIMCSPGV